jgi:hypothetical protein
LTRLSKRYQSSYKSRKRFQLHQLRYRDFPRGYIFRDTLSTNARTRPDFAHRFVKHPSEYSTAYSYRWQQANYQPRSADLCGFFALLPWPFAVTKAADLTLPTPFPQTVLVLITSRSSLLCVVQMGSPLASSAQLLFSL